VNLPKMAVAPNAGDALVYVNEDGSVRELTEAERKYVDTEFSPLDGARPYVKSSYLDRTAWGIQGYLLRTQVPDGVSIQPAPPQNAPQSQTPQAVADSLVELVRKHG
jgi:hypothetical protein